MTRTPFLAMLRRDKTGVAVIEFALLAPLLLAMSIGILAVGVQMQNYSAMRSLASDMNRYTTVEYQKSNALNETQIRDIASALAVNPRYGLKGDRLDVEVRPDVSPVAGAKKFTMTFTYTPALSFIGLDAPRLIHQQNIYVPSGI